MDGLAGEEVPLGRGGGAPRERREVFGCVVGTVEDILK